MKIKELFLDEKNKRKICFILAAIAAIYMIVHVYGSRQTKYLEDFKIYYYTAQAFKAGLNPYPAESINKIAGFDLKTIYRYAPYTFFIIGPLAELSYENALALFMALKALFLIGLLLVWYKLFQNMKFGYVFTVFLMIGFNACIYLDIKHGNISIFEQFFIWLGIYFFTQKKYALFSGFVIIASLFKLWPLLLLFILFADGLKAGAKRAVFSFMAFTGLQAILYFLMPGMYPDFIHASPAGEAGGGHEPTSYKFFLALFKLAGGDGGPLFYAASAAWAALIIVITAVFVSRAGEGRQWDKIFIIMLAYALIVPRMKDYSFILLLPAAYYFTVKTAGKYWSLLLLVLFSENFISRFVPVVAGEYYYFFTVIVIWILGLEILKNGGAIRDQGLEIRD